MPIYMIIALDIVITMRFSINLFTYHMLFVQERSPYWKLWPRVYLYHILKSIPCCNLFTLLLFYLCFCLSIYHHEVCQLTAKGLTTPCLRWVQVLVILCVHIVHEVLRGSPTGLITLVLNWGKYLSLLYCIILSSSRKPQRSSQVAGRISGAVAEETSPKPIKYHRTNFHLLAFTFIFHLPLFFISPTSKAFSHKHKNIFHLPFRCLLAWSCYHVWIWENYYWKC